MPAFKKITFNQSNGKLTVHTNGDPLYDQSIVDNGVWLKVLDNWNIEVDEISGSPDYTAKFPFGTSSNLGEIKFGEPTSNAVLKLREEDGTGTVHSMTIGNGGYFYLGFIGTDDLRNGLVNTGGFNMDNMGVYIKINTLPNSDCELEIGYQELA